MCHPGIPVPRRLAYKRSNSQPTNISHQILPTNCTKSRFHSKSKEVRFDTSPEIYVYRDGISNTTEYSQGTTGPSRIPTSDYQTFSFPNSSFGTNFPFSVGQTQCSSRFNSPRQTTLTSTSDVSFICLETTYSSSRSLRSDKQHDLIPLKMVDGHQSLRFALGTSIHPPEPNTFLFTDASHFGWGAHLDPMRLSFHGRWSEDQSQLHIIMLEMTAIRLALMKAIKYIHLSCVMISTNNTTVVSYINRQGGTHSPNLCVEVWKILHWCLEYYIMIRVRRISGKFNILADRLLRLDRSLKT